MYSASSVVRGPFCTWESFCVLWGMNLFFVSKIPASHWCLGVPPSPLLHSSVLYYRTYCCTAVLLPCYLFFFVILYIQRMIPLLVRTYCCIAVLLPYDYFVLLALNIQRIQHQFVFVRHTGRQQAYFGSTTSTWYKLPGKVRGIRRSMRILPL